MRRGVAWLQAALVGLLVGLAWSAAPTASAAVPAGFTDELVATVAAPTALAFTPDGRMLITTQGGRLRVVAGGTLLATAALDLSTRICSNSERGLLGVAVDPAFATNRFVYLFYTWNKHGVCEQNTVRAPVNRISRFVLGDNGLVDPVSEAVLVDNMPSPNGNHNAGDLAFGKDGYLYATIGDGGCDYAGDSGCGGANNASRDQHVLTGKVLRVTRDGAVPPGNPFLGADSASCAATGRTDPGKKCREAFAWGLRNPFRFAFDPNATTTRFYVNDVGQSAWEEIDLGTAGADYGWNVREGFCANGSTTSCGAPPPGMTNPVFAYGRSDGCASITGGAFVPDGVWPAEFAGKYLFADYVCGAIFRLDPATGGGFTRTPFATGLGAGSAVHLAFGPVAGGGRALYYTTYAGGGQVRRIRFEGAAPGPTFADVPASHPFYAEVEESYARGLTTGCGTNGSGQLLFCPTDDVKRQAMAAFVTRAMGLAPLFAPTPTFADVSATHPFYGEIERFYEHGITSGCGTNAGGQRIFCPTDNVRRQAMAAFITRARGLLPLRRATPTFADVPATHPFYGEIERFYEEGITTGCGTNGAGQPMFCPDALVKRQAMAAFLVRAFPASP